MKKLLAILLFIASPVLGTGPLYLSPSINDQLEHENIYKELRFPKISTGTAQNFYIVNGSGTVFSIATATISSGTIPSFAVTGTTTNDSAPSGRIGEYISSTVSGTNATTTAQYKDLTSFSLTAGDWDVSLQGSWDSNGATWTQARIGLGTVTGNDGTGTSDGDSLAITIWASSSATPLNVTESLPSIRVSIATKTTYYYKMLASYSAGGPPRLSGRISARRVR